MGGRSRSPAWAATAALALLAGCRAPLPEHPWRDTDTALAVMAERAASIGTVQSPAQLVLTTPAGDTVTLDAAIVAAPPDHFRLRAWKLGHAVLDLTLNPDGLWVKTDEGEPRDGVADGSGPGGVRGVTARGITDAWALLSGDLFTRDAARGGDAEGPEVIDDGGPTFTLRRLTRASATDALAGAAVIECRVDRRTLTARGYRVLDAAGLERATLSLDDYRDAGGIIFPMRMVAAGPDGAVSVRLDGPDFNLPIPPGAFTPPRGAIRHE